MKILKNDLVQNVIGAKIEKPPNVKDLPSLLEK